MKIIFILITVINLLSIFLFGQDSNSLDTPSLDSISVDSTDLYVTQFQYKIGDISDGNQSVPVHLIKLFDHEGYSIHKDDKPQIPFSTKTTCGDCHTYDLIKDGTHFSIDKADSTSQIGEPYIYTDHKSLTILPLSYRGWKGTFNPDSVGFSPFNFLKAFGSHFTGGNISENDDLEKPENFFRWQVSGKLEINCMVCHDADPEYDQAEFAKQIADENFRWATSGASSFANVKGKASRMPDNFDLYNSNTFVDVDLRTSPQPTITYDKTKFDSDNKVFFNIKKHIGKERCLFCHTNTINSNEDRLFKVLEDVHLTAGMSCVDCHKNNIGHDIIKGYPSEHIDKKNNQLHSFSCEGCHIKSEENNFAGRFGAPNPQHQGIPSLHFDKLSCTVCHSSFLPNEQPAFIKTSRSHKLGVPGPNKMESTFPLIQSPVYVKGNNGKIEPRNLLWTSYWAKISTDMILPLNLEFVNENIKPLLNLDSTYNFGSWPTIPDSTLIAILDTVANFFPDDKVVFVNGGFLYELDDNNNILKSEHESAEPYSWPVAHAVRPAQQSLGINGCEDCHSPNSNFYFADIPVISSIENDSRTVGMTYFKGLNSFYQTIFSYSFYFRPFLKFILILSAIIISLVVLSYLIGAIKIIAKNLSYNHYINNYESKE